MNTKIFKNAKIYTPHRLLEQGTMSVQNGIITGMEDLNDTVQTGQGHMEAIDMGGRIIVPGFIDVHVHGGGGYDVMSGEAEDLIGLSKYHASKGTTSLLATTLTADNHVINKALQNAARIIETGSGGAEIVGVHLEGPYISKKRCGAQNADYIRPGSIEELQSFIDASRSHIRLITIAPECEGNMELIRYACEQGITVSIGHSDANFASVKQAVRYGASHVTHLFNGMRPFHHRELGVAGAAMLLDQLSVELICDGHHVEGNVISFVFNIKPAERIILVTDCIAAAGCAEGEYDLAGIPVILQDGLTRLKNGGNLAGSCLSMDQALRNTIDFTSKDIRSILPALTINPARQINIHDRKGALEIGKDADFAVMDKEWNVMETYVKGRRVY